MWLADGEAASMARELGMSEERFVERFVRSAFDRRSRSARPALRESAHGERGGRCALLVGPNTCSVYAARPAQCRAFPYWPSVMADRDAFESARAACPGIAVLVPREIRERAFALLRELYDSAGPPIEPAGGAVHEGDVFVSGLEADYLAERGGRPLALHAGPRAAGDLFRRVREIERDTGYPSSYGPIADMMRARTSS